MSCVLLFLIVRWFEFVCQCHSFSSKWPKTLKQIVRLNIFHLSMLVYFRRFVFSSSYLDFACKFIEIVHTNLFVGRRNISAFDLDFALKITKFIHFNCLLCSSFHCFFVFACIFMLTSTTLVRCMLTYNKITVVHLFFAHKCSFWSHSVAQLISIGCRYTQCSWIYISVILKKTMLLRVEPWECVNKNLNKSLYCDVESFVC